MTEYELISLIVAIIGLVLSIIALILSYKKYKQFAIVHNNEILLDRDNKEWMKRNKSKPKKMPA